ncbi:MAG TPA: DUF885 domain-containing protein [Longimicrobiales bacterium]|nr:DUF885 domain-containing protein [Longimicrobiales bacterium]
MSAFSTLLDEFFEEWWSAHPTQATAVGLHDFDGDLERRDAASLAALAGRLREWLEAFEAAEPADVGERVDRTLVADQLRWRLHLLEQRRQHTRDPLLYIQPVLDSLYIMAVREYAPGAVRALRAAERMARLPRALDEARQNLTAPARVLTETAVLVARSGVALVSQVLPVYLGAAVQDDLRQFEEWDAACRAAEDALLGFARWLEEDALPRATPDFAAGRDTFERQLRWEHALPYGADEIAAFGDELVRDTVAELEELAVGLGGTHGWLAYARELEDADVAHDLVGAYAAAVDAARAFVLERDLVTLPPGEVLEVTPTPEHLRPLVPYAAYLPPAPYEPDQRGLFFVTPSGGGKPARPMASIASTTVHEAYPGHHVQLCRANRAGSAPRRVFWTPVFAEGWALYCEDLMWEEGFLTDPRQRFLQLKDRLWRACRVVADVGLHTAGWNPERAQDLLVGQAGLDPASAEAEVRRYCATPTQPLSYAVGRREILRLRERWRARAGEAAPLREFHDALLSWGTIPPALVAEAMGLG